MFVCFSNPIIGLFFDPCARFSNWWDHVTTEEWGGVAGGGKGKMHSVCLYVQWIKHVCLYVCMVGD